MFFIISYVILLIASVFFGILCFCLLWELLSASFVKPKDSPTHSIAPARATILVPAHNEEKVLLPTLQSLKKEIDPEDQIIVIADNCDDSTADLAKSMDVTVLERDNADKRGKGFALDHGMAAIQKDPPDIVMVVDADCHVEKHSLKHLKNQVIATNQPAQAIYLLESPQNPGLKEQVSTFAFKVKNLVRPLGLANFGISCPLTGTGMAFPWAAISEIDLASSEIVEDMKLGLDLAISNYYPLLCPQARVTGQLPSQSSAAETQRTRWEHGHMQLLMAYVPKLLIKSLRERRWELAVIAIDLAIPPLSLLVTLWTLTFVGSVGVSAMYQNWIPLIAMSTSGFMLFGGIFTTWVVFGQDDLSAYSLLFFPFYILWKIPLYLKLIFNPQKQWIRTERNNINS